MQYRVEVYDQTLRQWVPFTEGGFVHKEDAETRRLEILSEYGSGLADKGRLRVAEFETEDERRARALSAWREMFPKPVTDFDVWRESLLLDIAGPDGIETALVRARNGVESGAVDWD